MKVSIVIPVYNEEDKIIETMSSLLNNKVDVNFIVIDDSSTDNTFNNVSNYFKNHSATHILVKNETGKSGAGVCRNLGISLLDENSDYCLFFDADDLMPNGALDKMVESIEINGSDVVVTGYEYFISDKSSLGMGKLDVKIWEKIIKNDNEITFSPHEHPLVCKLINYPWNKLVRTSFLLESKIRFSETPVHNDILGHWLTLMYANKVTMLNINACHHYVITGRTQITNISDKRRLSVFQALRDVEDVIRSDEDKLSIFLPYFYSFKKEVISWAKTKLTDDLVLDFDKQCAKSYSQLTASNVLSTSFVDLDAALFAAKFKVSTHV